MAVQALKVPVAGWTPAHIAALNKFTSNVATQLTQDQSSISYLTGRLGNNSSSGSGTATGTTAPAVTGAAVAQSIQTIDGNTWVKIAATYTAPSPLSGFNGIVLAVKGLFGSTAIKAVGADDFAGSAGGPGALTIVLPYTDESVTFYFVSRAQSGALPSDWSTSPSTGLTLNGGSTAPATPTGIGATNGGTGGVGDGQVGLVWAGNTEADLRGYRVYRNTSNDHTTATVVFAPCALASGAMSFIDFGLNHTQTYYYWVTAVNSVGQESAFPSSVSGTA